MALELVLKSLLTSTKFTSSSEDEKDWVSIAKLIPGATPKQCAKKWDELCHNRLFIAPGSDLNDDLDSVANYLLHKQDKSPDELIHAVEDDGVSIDKDVSLTEQTSEKEVSSKIKTENVTDQKKDSMMVNKKFKPKQPSTDGPKMVIHVCDESKNLKQDFLCPRDLLVNEMKYFAEYLSLEPQRWEEVDISVHCDVQIFDWLMRYVKRDATNSDDDVVPGLEPNNVISILISSDFLRMDSLVTKCIHYCHENMSAIVSTPCNMNCINDKLVTRISKLFNHSELDAVKDRKDKFKSKLFCKKIEEFVEGSPGTNSSSQEDASTLFRCVACKRLLTAKNQCKVPCVLNRMHVDSRGEISYSHSRDALWDINDHLVSLKEKLKTWRDVYWRLWGSTNILYCHQCRCYFPCTELGHCQYHTSSSEYKGKSDDLAGVYPCCQQKALLYDSIGVFTGCRVKDHLLQPPGSPTVPSDPDDNNEQQDKSSSLERIPSTSSSHEATKRQNSKNIVNDPTIINDLLAHRDIICLPYQRLASARTSELNIFNEDESIQDWKSSRHVSHKFPGNVMDKRAVVDRSSSLPPIKRTKTNLSQRMPSARRKTAILQNNEYLDSNDDEEEGEEELRNIKVHHFRRIKKRLTAEERQSSSGFRWDPQRSPRWNQDAQREEDSKRMNEVITTMAKLRSATTQEKKSKSKEFPGGIFHKLDHQFRVSIQPPVVKHQNSNNQILSSSRGKRIGKS
ncbi:uncharacterized protein KIAA1841 homolog [Dendronephthya gigantea]|uniref:uncharacterized protein KIAA1841 homolog n=1 Tax=Dendronephthya gigantea TaxID=151771 RepID=UPI0010699636|nr:uncharacterized protein KIAA1841 homolog [Dendronephthya gigantea]XP_028400725.1 uncharacterized protein KIAA1841 homolog [Dendronephthya gigantea]XP_028400726.1 uncharacterized protein KIAA1841 homolog [Dendronephthya gigantea]XP_028400727.1 uncharacterized protein KIAA1841 homolog [Dendronephthya gigantea]